MTPPMSDMACEDSAAGIRPTPRWSDASPLDILIVGSGWGGAMAAHQLVGAGLRVGMVERGDWVGRGPRSWAPDATLELHPAASWDTARHGPKAVCMVHCVGGASVFAGGAALRFRERDFAPDAEQVGRSDARWPLTYADLEPWYARAEALLHVAGRAGEDPCEAPRSTPFPQPAPELSPTAQRMAAAARRAGHRCFALPLALPFQAPPGRPVCARCTRCDAFACAVGAKRDAASAVLGPLLARGLELRTGLAAVQLVRRRRRVIGVLCRDTSTGAVELVRADHVVLSAGALASPALLQASGLAALNPAGDAIGRYLTRHCNAIAMGVFARRLPGYEEFHKQLAIHDLYEQAGALQQVAVPPEALLRRHGPAALGLIAGPLRARCTGWLAIAEDQPHADNRVRADPNAGRHQPPRIVIKHRYSPRDLARRARLVTSARQILRTAGALHVHVVPLETFSHALGTVRMGDDPRTAPLDRDCRFRGLDNLHVIDGACLPTSAAVNPSLTIAALALRAGAQLAQQPPSSLTNASQAHV